VVRRAHFVKTQAACASFLLATILGASAGPVAAYDFAAHRAITSKAIPEGRSRVDDILRQLGLPDGTNTLVGDSILGVRSARDAIIEGSAMEDEPPSRVVNHFHNPLAGPWSEAGLRVGGLQIGRSSVLWQQDAGQDRGWGGRSGTWSWPVARQSYYDALTLGSSSERSAAFGRLFRSIGQMMHLTQDASLPAHTRNDAHLYGAVPELRVGVITVPGRDVGDGDQYERWVDRLSEADLAVFLNRPAVKPSDRVFTRIGTAPRIDRAAAPAPVSGLIDTGQYNGTNPDVTMTPSDGRPLVGLAEYSNANVLSDDTIFSPSSLESLPFPSPASVTRGPYEVVGPKYGGLRQYFYKMRHGDSMIIDASGAARRYRVALAGALAAVLPDNDKMRNTIIDSRVLEDYGALLLPRAVGYSAALVDHFFRGPIAATDLQDPVNALIRTFTIINGSPDEDASGTFELYVEPEDGARTLWQSWSLTIFYGTSAAVSVPRLPMNTPPTTRCMLVFRGLLGSESDAVAGTLVSCPLEVPPPAPYSQTLWKCRLFGVPNGTTDYQVLETQILGTDDPEVPPDLRPPYILYVSTFWDCRHI
jgi:hypothetical protein